MIILFWGGGTSAKVSLTPANQQEEPPLLGQCAEDYHQHEEEHDALTQHPAEHGQEEVVQQGCHCRTQPLQNTTCDITNCDNVLIYSEVLMTLYSQSSHW